MKLNPFLHDGSFVFVKTSTIPDNVIAFFAENEGFTVIVSKQDSEKLGYKSYFEAAWITLLAETSLNDLGITAVFSKALSDNGISCNVFAPIHHDHIFVPFDKRFEAMKILEKLEF